VTEILQALLHGEPVHGRHLVVTAHADDETVSFGGALSMLTDATVLQITTGAPVTDRIVTEQRQRERCAAFAAAGWPWPVVEAAVPGREAHRHLATLQALLAEALVGVDVVWTHPYEAGHLDHDTAAWLVQQVCGFGGPVRMEFASYHCNALTQTFGDFWPDATVPAVHVPLAGDRLTRKRAAMAAYESQAAILRKFPTPEIEAYRVAPRYDFTKPAAPPRARWDVKRYQPSTQEWRRLVAAVEVAA
jgi:LmbE family N-acetylglucosaminyl deacetylase